MYSTGAQATTDGLTILRTRGYVDFAINSNNAIGDGYRGAVGLCIVSENAFNAGIGSVPTPITDLAWDGWFWYQFFNLMTNNATAGDLGENAVASYVRFVIDAKAMRKIKDTDVIIAVLEVTEVGTSTFRSFLNSRILIQQV